MAIRTLIFDLDGTLVDTAPDLVASLNAVFARRSLPSLPYEKARNLIGGGTRMMIARAVATQGVALAPANLEQLFADFIAYYGEHIAEHSRPFPGLAEVLDTLAIADTRLAVCTNKLERL